MTVVLDTCAVLALAAGTLSAHAVSEIRRADEASVSSVTAWEIAIKVAAGKLQLNGPPERWFADFLDHYVLREVHLDARLACAAAALPRPSIESSPPPAPLDYVDHPCTEIRWCRA